MSKKTFKKQDVEAAINKDTDENSPLVLEEAGQWLDEGKYQFQENILRDISTGLFYSYGLSKSGSYFSEVTYSFEWEEDEIELVEVESIIIETEIWAAVEPGRVKGVK